MVPSSDVTATVTSGRTPSTRCKPEWEGVIVAERNKHTVWLDGAEQVARPFARRFLRARMRRASCRPADEPDEKHGRGVAPTDSVLPRRVAAHHIAAKPSAAQTPRWNSPQIEVAPRTRAALRRVGPATPYLKFMNTSAKVTVSTSGLKNQNEARSYSSA
jgi:hypothetical protein